MLIRFYYIYIDKQLNGWEINTILQTEPRSESLYAFLRSTKIASGLKTMARYADKIKGDALRDLLGCIKKKKRFVDRGVIHVEWPSLNKKYRKSKYYNSIKHVQETKNMDWISEIKMAKVKKKKKIVCPVSTKKISPSTIPLPSSNIP